jgi:predicted ATPase
MITRVEAKQYRCFQSVRQEVSPLQVLVGPNGSGKSVFLDVIGFLSTFMSSGLYKAVEDRSSTFMTWFGGETAAALSSQLRRALP